MNDALYGLTPDPSEDFGVNLGALAPRGERNVLIASLDSVLRGSSNPFFPYMKTRIEEGIDSRSRAKTQHAAQANTPANWRLEVWRHHCVLYELFSGPVGPTRRAAVGQVWSSQLNHNRRRVAPWLTGGGYS
jgi:hypothetical protein